jgi:hypothetical protein
MRIARQFLLAFVMVVAISNAGSGMLPAAEAATSFTYYVDASVSSSGNGLSWGTAFKTLSEATNASLQPGTTVLIKPGIYRERIQLRQSGAAVVPLTTGVKVSDRTKITFPPGTDLSDIDLASFPGQYYAYVYRSWASNNGVYPVVEVNTASRSVIVAGTFFVDEEGVAGNTSYLSASIGRPIVFKKASTNPQNERVILDASQLSASTMLYIGDYIDPHRADPVNYNIVDGLDLTGSPSGGGVHIQSSSFNVIENSRIYDQEGVGILIAGHNASPAQYNLVINNTIYNTPFEGVYIGSGDGGEIYNHAHFNHVIDNEIFTQGSASNAVLENAIDVKEYNHGTVVEGNLIRDIALTSYNGALDIRNEANDTLVYSNVFKNLTRRSSGTHHIINVFHDTQDVLIFNNLIYNTALQDDAMYAIHVQADNTQDVLIVHNTIYRIDRGMLLEYDTPGGNGSDNGTLIANNIFNAIPSNLVVEWVENGASKSHFDLSHNLFPRDPGGDYAVAADFIGDPNFANAAAGDFHLSTGSGKAINRGMALSPAIVRDFDLLPRSDGLPDLGAFESQLPLDTPDLTPPVLQSPKDRSNTGDTTPRLRWKPVPGAAQYQVQVAADPAFTVKIIDEYVESAGYTVPNASALAYGTYYWRVEAGDAFNTWGDWSSPSMFTVTLLQSPENGGFTTDDTPTFRWRRAAGADQYQIQVATDPAFAHRAIDEMVTGTRYRPETALADGQYYWRVRVQVSGSWSKWMPAWTVTLTPEPPGKPLLTTPANNTQLTDATPTFTWETVDGSNTYQIQIDDQANFKSPVQDATVGALTYTADALSDSRTYYWRVRAINPYGVAGQWSRRWKFVLGGPDTPTRLSPENRAILGDDTPLFSWEGLAGFSTYQIQIGGDKNFKNVVDEMTVDTTSYTPAQLPDGTYYWRVRTVNNVGVGGDWTSGWRFAIDTTGPDALVLKYPRDTSGITTTLPTFKWSRPKDAARYHIQVSPDAQFNALPVNVEYPNPKYPLDDPLAYGRYFWRVRAQDALGNWGEWSLSATFTVTILKSPRDGSSTTDATPTFKWAAVQGVSEYRLQVAYGATFSNLLINQSVDSTRFTPDTPLLQSLYYWRVSADGGATWMPAWTVTVTSRPPKAPRQLAPRQNALIGDAEPTFTWNMVKDGFTYQIQIDDSKQFTSPVQDKTLEPGELTYTAEALADGTYYWRVRAFNNTGTPGAWSKGRVFTIDTTPAAAPVLIAPLDAARVTNKGLKLEWESVPGADRYEVQLDTSPAFPLPPIDAGRKSSYSPPATLTQALYNWRVRAIDAAGNVGPWSGAQTFHLIAGDTALLPLDAAWQYVDSAAAQVSGGWTLVDDAQASQGRYLLSSGTPGEALELVFTGSQIAVGYIPHPALGRFTVEVDGVLYHVVDSAAPLGDGFAWVRVDGLPSGSHTLRVVTVEGPVAIDGFAIGPDVLDVPPALSTSAPVLVPAPADQPPPPKPGAPAADPPVTPPAPPRRPDVPPRETPTGPGDPGPARRN